MDHEGRWIKFVMAEKKPATQVFHVISKEHEFVLGVIKWYPSWRKYAFFPNPDTVFEQVCLSDIGNFLSLLMERRSRKA